MTTDKSPETAPGYRGALPPKNDWLARGWVLVVIAIFFGIFILAALNVPTVLLPEPTPVGGAVRLGGAQRQPRAKPEPLPDAVGPGLAPFHHLLVQRRI